MLYEYLKNKELEFSSERRDGVATVAIRLLTRAVKLAFLSPLLLLQHNNIDRISNVFENLAWELSYLLCLDAMFLTFAL